MKLRSAEAHKHNKIAGIVGVILTVITAVALFCLLVRKRLSILQQTND